MQKKERPAVASHGQLTPLDDSARWLDAEQLQDLECSFRSWAQSSRQPALRHSRRRILIIFLLIRYTGARLNEVLSLDPTTDFDFENSTVHFIKKQGDKGASSRIVQIPDTISAEIQEMASDPQMKSHGSSLFHIDPSHVRRKFYEHAASIGIPRNLGIPEGIRKSRAVELMRGNMPLPVVQRLMGHSSPHLTASFVEFSEEEIQQVARYFMDRENLRKTSARNAFFGKVSKIHQGDIQAVVEVVSVNGALISAVITRDSLDRIGLKAGMLIKAEVKAPWVQLCRGTDLPKCSADNIFQGTVYRIRKGRITVEIVIRLFDDTELCAIITQKSFQRLALDEQDQVFAFFDAFAVILHID